MKVRTSATATGKGGRQETPGQGSATNGSAAADGTRRLRFRDPVHGGSGRVDDNPREARVLIIHEQHGRYSRDQLEALAQRVGAPSLGEFFNQPFRWMEPFAAGPGQRRASSVPLPSEDQIAAWMDKLWTDAGRQARRWLVRERGVSLDVIEAARIGWDRHRLILPMYGEGGRLVAVKWRMPDALSKTRSWSGQGRAWPLYPGCEDVAAVYGWVLLLAGDLDALAARSADLPGVSVTCGAGTWREGWTEQLRGARVVVCFDNNEAKEARERVAVLKAAGIRARRLDLRRLGLADEKGDVSDYLSSGGDPARLRRPQPRRAIQKGLTK